jgi:hypothetical protein
VDELLVITQTEWLVLETDGVLEVLDATEPTQILEVAQQGPPGKDGMDGETDKTLRFEQPIPSALWTITHGMNKYPSVAVQDSAGDSVEGAVVYLSLNSLTLSFSAAFGGSAYLN